MRLALLSFFLAWPGMALGQSVTLPDTTTGVPGQWIVLAPLKVDGGPVKWRFDPALQEVNLGQLLPDEMVNKLKGKVVTTTAAGRYKYEAWNAKGDVASDIAVGWVVILGPTPPPLPPTPPVPPPPVPPPPSPAPIPVAGLRVLVVFEATSGNPLLTKNQINELWGAEMANYAKDKFAKGADGTPEFRRFDRDIDPSKLNPVWKEFFGVWQKDAKDIVPWIVISNGTTGFSGPLPDGGALALIRRYEK